MIRACHLPKGDKAKTFAERRQNKKKKIKAMLKNYRFYLLLFVFCLPFAGQASHIVGGEITYECLGNDSYRISLEVPGDVCVHTTHYEKVVTLPPIPGGYQFVYQRCCRNQTISNIINPDHAGMTLLTYMSEQSMLDCNSGPDFTFIPPIFICVNKPIVFDHSAVDAEGDSLVYKLCTPYHGG